MFWIWCTEHFDWLDGLSWFVAHQNIKRSLYFTFVRSHLMFCSQVLRPFLIKDSRALEKLQMRAAKYTVNDSSLDYNSKLLNLNIFPLSLLMEFRISFICYKVVKIPPDNVSILNYISFISSSIQSSDSIKIKSINHTIPYFKTTHHFFFIKIWNSLLICYLDASFYVIIKDIEMLYWNYFINIYDHGNPCTWFRCCPFLNCTVTCDTSSCCTQQWVYCSIVRRASRDYYKLAFNRRKSLSECSLENVTKNVL